ncbi:MAG: sulfite exporter TauE/SafE family protein [Jatrophihabitantaceae bacterium]
MAPWQALLLVPAGVGAGLTGSMAGLASLISYPALLAVGLGPVTANVTNTVSLVFNSVGSVSGSRPELAGRTHRLLPLALAGLTGGALGAILLLILPPGSFARVVPWLIGLGSLSILLPRPAADSSRPAGRDTPAVVAAVGLIAVYGGYFGAAAGVVMLALLLRTSHDSLPRANAVKNLVLGVSNLVAAVLFAIIGSVDWAAALPLAIGLLVGGRIGPAVVRRSPTTLLRLVIAVLGLGLAAFLAVDAYH